MDRAKKELKGFQKVIVAKEEHSKFKISIDPNSLKYYDESVYDWKLEHGNYMIYVGNASNNISKKIKIQIY